MERNPTKRDGQQFSMMWEKHKICSRWLSEMSARIMHHTRVQAVDYQKRISFALSWQLSICLHQHSCHVLNNSKSCRSLNACESTNRSDQSVPRGSPRTSPGMLAVPCCSLALLSAGRLRSKLAYISLQLRSLRTYGLFSATKEQSPIKSQRNDRVASSGHEGLSLMPCLV